MSTQPQYQYVQRNMRDVIFDGASRLRPTRKHIDLQQMFSHLAIHREDILRTWAGDGARAKQHTAQVYAERKGVEIQTRIRDGWLYIRLRIKITAPQPKKYQITTAAEWMESRQGKRA